MHNPWNSLTNRAPYVLGEDEPYIRAHNGQFDLSEAHRIVLDEPPEPFLGPMDAPVVILQLNPGIAHGFKPNERDAVRAGLSSPSAIKSHPLIEHRNAWWNRLVKAHAKDIPLGRIATRIQSVEYFPYRSTSFGFGHLRLPSQGFGFDLARSAVRRQAEIVITRGAKFWYGAIPELFEHPHVYVVRNLRSASLSEANLGTKVFRRIRDALLA